MVAEEAISLSQVFLWRNFGMHGQGLLMHGGSCKPTTLLLKVTPSLLLPGSKGVCKGGSAPASLRYCYHLDGLHIYNYLACLSGGKLYHWLSCHLWCRAFERFFVDWDGKALVYFSDILLSDFLGCIYIRLVRILHSIKKKNLKNVGTHWMIRVQHQFFKLLVVIYYP